MTRYALRADDGYGVHLESGLQYVTLCGRYLPEATRETYTCPDDPKHPHARLCFDCHTVKNGGSITPRRREIHFGGEPA